jgi:hypothetical protein
MSFSSYVQGHAATSVELPLVHTITCFRLNSYCRRHSIQTSPCKVFDENLTYFFYGRPSYRDRSATKPVRDIGVYPVCFVFKPGAISVTPRRLYPFDSGAFGMGLYNPAIPASQALLMYELANRLNLARSDVPGHPLVIELDRSRFVQIQWDGVQSGNYKRRREPDPPRG